jgi:hypothetical protein
VEIRRANFPYMDHDEIPEPFIHIIVIKPGPAQRVDPGTGPVRVAQKTGECKKPVRPGGSTRVRPGTHTHRGKVVQAEEHLTLP